MTVGPIEPKFFAQLLQLLDIDPESIGAQSDRAAWPKARERLAAVFLTRTRDAWTQLLQDSDACFAPVLNWAEAPEHPHLRERETFVSVGDISQPAPAPRFSRTVPDVPTPPAPNDVDVEAALAPWLSAEDIQSLRSAGTVR